MISCVAAFWLVLTYDLLEKRRINDVPINDILFFIFDDIYKKKKKHIPCCHLPVSSWKIAEVVKIG